MKKLTLILVLLFCSAPMWAQITLDHSTQHGAWSNIATWASGAVPTCGDAVEIDDPVTLDVNVCATGGTGQGLIRVGSANCSVGTFTYAGSSPAYTVTVTCVAGVTFPVGSEILFGCDTPGPNISASYPIGCVNLAGGSGTTSITYLNGKRVIVTASTSTQFAFAWNDGNTHTNLSSGASGKAGRYGALCSDDGTHHGVCGYAQSGAVTIAMNSTSTMKTGSAAGGGTAANPGSAAAVQGIIVPAGEVHLISGSGSGNLITVQAYTSTNATYIDAGSVWYNYCTAATIATNGCATGLGGNTTKPVTIQLAGIHGINFGSTTGGHEGLSYACSTGVQTSWSVTNSQFDGLIGSSQSSANVACATPSVFTFNYVTDAVGINTAKSPQNIYPILKFQGGETGTTITDNTILNGTDSVQSVMLVYFSPNHSNTFNISRNALLNTTTAAAQAMTLTFDSLGTTGGGDTIDANLVINPEPTDCPGNPSNCSYEPSLLYYYATNDATTISRNTIQGGRQGIYLSGSVITGSGVNVYSNWASTFQPDWNGQGTYFPAGGNWNLYNNVAVVEDCPPGHPMANYYPYDNPPNPTQFVGTNNVSYMPCNDAAVNMHIKIGDSPGGAYAPVNSAWHSNVITGGNATDFCVNSNNENVQWVTTGANSYQGGLSSPVGVHHNNCYSSLAHTTMFYVNTAPTQALNPLTTTTSTTGSFVQYLFNNSSNAIKNGLVGSITGSGRSEYNTTGTISSVTSTSFQILFADCTVNCTWSGTGTTGGTFTYNTLNVGFIDSAAHQQDANPALYMNNTANPNYFDITRRPDGYASSACGLSSGYTNLFNYLSYRSTAAAALASATYNSCIDLAKLNSWMLLGWTPYNGQLKNAGAVCTPSSSLNTCDQGAVNVYPPAILSN